MPLALWMGLISSSSRPLARTLAIALPAPIAVLSDDPWDAVWVIIFATVYQQIENYYFSPRISSRTMDIHRRLRVGDRRRCLVPGRSGALIGIPVAGPSLAFLAAHQPLRTVPGAQRGGG